MPSKPAVTWKCQCFKNPTPLSSAAVGCVCFSSVCGSVRACVRGGLPEPHRAYSGSYYAHPRRSREGMQDGTHRTSQHPHPSRLRCHFVPPPEHPTTSARSHCTAFPHTGLCLETGLQHLKLLVLSWKKVATKAPGSFQKETDTCKHYWCCPINVLFGFVQQHKSISQVFFFSVG